MPIGAIDGCPVTASYMDTGQLYAARMVWSGLTISTDGEDYINLPSDGGCVGDVSPVAWHAFRNTDVVERLMALARAKMWIAPLPGTDAGALTIRARTFHRIFISPHYTGRHGQSSCTPLTHYIKEAPHACITPFL